MLPPANTKFSSRYFPVISFCRNFLTKFNILRDALIWSISPQETTRTRWESRSQNTDDFFWAFSETMQSKYQIWYLGVATFTVAKILARRKIYGSIPPNQTAWSRPFKVVDSEIVEFYCWLWGPAWRYYPTYFWMHYLMVIFGSTQTRKRLSFI